MYSYIKTEADGKITEVKEKVKISDNANSGCYCFMSGDELQKQCTDLLSSKKTQTGALSTHTVGEYYTSGVIANMIEQGALFKGLQIDPKLMYVLGTPTQARTLASSATASCPSVPVVHLSLGTRSVLLRSARIAQRSPLTLTPHGAA